MCGIAGIIELKGNLTAQVRELIAPMTKCLRHRGPDATNYFHHQQFCYGNSRLAIMDPSSHASLPFCTPSKDLVLCFNGEISNFEELARRFKLHEKYPFISHSDAEVLLYLYKDLGIDCLKHLSGMFSFALYDQLRNQIFIVRDFFGLTPLFYSCCDQRIFFASEIKALLQNTSLERTLNQEAFFHLLSLGYMPKQHTPYQ